jgi:hypothetical protein
MPSMSKESNRDAPWTLCASIGRHGDYVDCELSLRFEKTIDR